MTLDEKFKALETNNAPGQEVRQNLGDLNTIMLGEKLDGIPVDFSHGDVDAFPPTPSYYSILHRTEPLPVQETSGRSIKG